MTLAEISNLRIVNQHITATEFKTVNEIVRWMGAMQAQDYAMAKWAIGLRLPHSTEPLIETAMHKGEIIRTHVMRPTWHFVAAEDVHWMLTLTASRIKSSMKARHNELELSEAVLSKSRKVIERALANGESLTREELASEFEKANIKTNENRLSHLLLCAELDGVVCSGMIKGVKRTYALLQSRIPHKNKFTRDESLAELAKRYFTSHGPATFQDFYWWSGLSVSDARHALESVKSTFLSETVGAEQYWLTNSSFSIKHNKNSVHLLPAYDEFLISYKERSASLSQVNNRKAISNNGIFYPVIVANGQVAGLWKRTIKKETVVVETKFFQQLNKTMRTLIEEQAKQFGCFLNKEPVVKHTTL